MAPDDSALGWLNTAFVLLYAAVGVPLGRLSDRWVRTKILGLGVTVGACSLPLPDSRGLLVALRRATRRRRRRSELRPGANSLIGDFFAPHKRARAISIFMLGLPIGIFASNLSSGIIAKTYGWRITFFIACVPGLILAALALRIREPHREELRNTMSLGVNRKVRRTGGSQDSDHLVDHSSGALHNFNAYAVNAFLPLSSDAITVWT